MIKVVLGFAANIKSKRAFSNSDIYIILFSVFSYDNLRYVDPYMLVELLFLWILVKSFPI